MSNIETEAVLTVEAILREMSRATRWSTINDARFALLNVRRISDGITKEQSMFTAEKMRAEVSGYQKAR